VVLAETGSTWALKADRGTVVKQLRRFFQSRR